MIRAKAPLASNMKPELGHLSLNKSYTGLQSDDFISPGSLSVVRPTGLSKRWKTISREDTESFGLILVLVVLLL